MKVVCACCGTYWRTDVLPGWICAACNARGDKEAIRRVMMGAK